MLDEKENKETIKEDTNLHTEGTPESVKEELKVEKQEQETEAEIEENLEEETEIEEVEEVEEVEEIQTKQEEVSFIRTFQAIVIDEILLASGSFVGIYVIDFILRIVGYRIVKMMGMYSIVLVLSSILYMSIMEGSKNHSTIGKRMLKLTVENTK